MQPVEKVDSVRFRRPALAFQIAAFLWCIDAAPQEPRLKTSPAPVPKVAGSQAAKPSPGQIATSTNSALENAARAYYRGDKSEYYRIVKVFAEAGNSFFQRALAYHVSESAEKLKWLQLAASQGNTTIKEFPADYLHEDEHRAQFSKLKEKLATIEAPTEKVLSDYRLVFVAFQKVAEVSGTKAQRMFGSLVDRNGVLPEWEKQAHLWWKRAADAGDAEAQHLLADRYSENGDNSSAVLLYRKLTQRPDYCDQATAYASLGKLYLLGKGVEKSQVTAERLFAAGEQLRQLTQGCPGSEGPDEARSRKVHFFRQVAESYREAKNGPKWLEWLERGAPEATEKTEISIAQRSWIFLDLASAHINGELTPRDPHRGLESLRKAVGSNAHAWQVENRY